MVLRVLTLVAMLLVIPDTSAQVEEFVIGPGDSLLIEVYNERDLTVRAKIPNSGVLRIPLLGDVEVTNKTTHQLANELEQLYLDGYLVEPSVTVRLEGYRPFYIRGAVKKAGAYSFELAMTLDKAIAVAGGLKDRASKSEWYIIRGVDKQRFKVNRDSKVFPGDIIEIEESLF